MFFATLTKKLLIILLIEVKVRSLFVLDVSVYVMNNVNHGAI